MQGADEVEDRRAGRRDSGDPAAQMTDVAGGMDFDRSGLRRQFAVCSQTGHDGLGDQRLFVPILRGIEIERSGPGCPGECIGEMSLTRATPRSATVRALSNSTVWHLAGSVFETLIAQGDTRATHILQGLQVEICRRFRDELLVGAELAARASAVDEGRLLVESLGWEV